MILYVKHCHESTIVTREVLLTGLERWSETQSLGIGRLAETRVAQLEATAGVSPQVEAYNAVIRTGALQRCMWVEECFWTNFKDVGDEMLSLIQSSFLSPFLEISLWFILLFFPIFRPIDSSNQSHFFVVGLSARSYAEASSLATPWSACWCFFFDSLKYSYAQVGDSNSASQWLARCGIETTCICRGSGKGTPIVTYTTHPHLLRNRITVYLFQWLIAVFKHIQAWNHMYRYCRNHLDSFFNPVFFETLSGGRLPCRWPNGSIPDGFQTPMQVASRSCARLWLLSSSLFSQA